MPADWCFVAKGDLSTPSPLRGTTACLRGRVSYYRGRVHTILTVPLRQGDEDRSDGGGGLKGEMRNNDNQRLFLTQRPQRAQSFITFPISRLRWSGRKLRYDKSAQRVLSTPSPTSPLGVDGFCLRPQFAFAPSVARSQRLLQR